MKARNLFLVIILLLQVLSFSVFAATTSDDVTYTALGLENNNGEAIWYEGMSVTSPAEYAGYLQVNAGDFFFGNGESSLASTTSGGIVSSVTIHWGTSAVSGTDRISIYASNTAYEGEEVSGAGTLITTIVCDGSASQTFNTFASNYAYVLLVSNYYANVASVNIEWAARTEHAITKVADHGTITTKIGKTTVSAAYEGDVVSVRMTRRSGFAMTGYSIYKTSDPSTVVMENSFEPTTAAQNVNLTMPDYPVTIEVYFVSEPTKDLSPSIQDALGNDLTDLVALTSGEPLTYTYSVSSDYVGTVTVECSDETKARCSLAPANAYSGTLTINPYAVGSVTITLKFGADANYRANNLSSCTPTVARRPVALVTQYNDEYYAVTKSLASYKFVSLATVVDDKCYYNPSTYTISDITWYVETVYNAYADMFHIYSTTSGAEQIYVLGENFYLSSDERFWMKEGGVFYGETDSKGIVFNSTASNFVPKDKDTYTSNSSFSPSVHEVPIAEVEAAKQYSTTSGSANLYDGRSLTAGKMGTICVPFDVPMSFVSGATFYTIESKLVSAGNLTGLNLAEVTDKLEAGHSYIFEATGSSIDIYYGSASATNASVIANDGFVGMLPGDGASQNVPDGVTPRENGCYGIYSNQLRYVAAGGTATIKPYRAYIDASELSSGSPAPGRRVVLVDNSESGEQTYTSVEDLLNNATSINWNEPVYNVLGQRVGKGTTGVLIQNGKKFFVQ